MQDMHSASTMTNSTQVGFTGTSLEHTLVPDGVMWNLFLGGNGAAA